MLRRPNDKIFRQIVYRHCLWLLDKIDHSLRYVARIIFAIKCYGFRSRDMSNLIYVSIEVKEQPILCLTLIRWSVGLSVTCHFPQ